MGGEDLSKSTRDRLARYAKAHGKTIAELKEEALNEFFRSRSLGDWRDSSTTVKAGGSAHVTNNHFVFGDFFSNNFSNNVVRFMIPGLPEGLNATARNALLIAFGLGAIVGGVLVVLWLSSLASG